MEFLTYLTTTSAQLGTLGWLFFIAQILGLAAGAYLVFLHSERNAARAAFMRNLGIALLIVGGIGVLVGVLRMLNVPFFNQHLSFWIQAAIELVLAGYVVYYTRSVLPAMEKQAAGRRPSRSAPSPRGLRSVSASSIETTPATPRPVPTTGRRDARRDRKRRKG